MTAARVQTDFQVQIQEFKNILLRGEVSSSIDSSIEYLYDIQKLVDTLIADGATKHDLLEHDIERFGRSRIPLGGLVQQFHSNNLLHLWEKARAEQRRQRQAAREMAAAVEQADS